MSPLVLTGVVGYNGLLGLYIYIVYIIYYRVIVQLHFLRTREMFLSANFGLPVLVFFTKEESDSNFFTSTSDRCIVEFTKVRLFLDTGSKTSKL